MLITALVRVYLVIYRDIFCIVAIISLRFQSKRVNARTHRMELEIRRCPVQSKITMDKAIFILDFQLRLDDLFIRSFHSHRCVLCILSYLLF